MPVQKRKATMKTGDRVFGRAKPAKCEEVEHEEEDEQMAAEEEDAPEAEEEQEQVSPEEELAKAEEETMKARRKELKAMYASDLNELASASGLELRKKDEMVEAIVTHEANQRAAVREQAARVRQAVVQKKEELEALALPDLRQRCHEVGIKGNISKQERVEQLLKLWQEDDGVDKALAEMARAAREAELQGMDKATLQQLCANGQVDPYVREVMVDRLVRKEIAKGLFKRPEVQKLAEDGDEAEADQSKKEDLVESLLANEANRKRDRELKRQREDAAAARIKELKAKTNDELKEMIISRGGEANGKKEELVDLLIGLLTEEEKTAAKKAKLKSMSIEELKSLASKRGLPAGKKDEMVDSLLAYEAKQRERLQEYETKAAEIMAGKKAELEALTANQLKDMCMEKGLKAGTAKDERVERLVEAAAADGEVEKSVAGAASQARRVELLTLDVSALTSLCEENLVDPLVKEIMVERLLAREEELGHAIEPQEERKTKKAKTTK